MGEVTVETDGHAEAGQCVEERGQADVDPDGCREPLRDLVVACLAKDPRQRPTPAEIVERCQVTVATSPPPAAPAPTQLLTQPVTEPTQVMATQPVHPAPSVAQPRPHVGRRGLLLGGAALVVAAGLGVGIPLLWPDDDDAAAANDGDGTGTPKTSGPFRQVATFTGHTASINSIAFSPDGALLASMSGAEGDVVGRGRAHEACRVRR